MSSSTNNTTISTLDQNIETPGSPDHDDDGGESSSTSSGPCPCSNIAIMQLFHELKAEFPAVPDLIVSQCITEHLHDRQACRSLLSAEQARLPRGVPYPPVLAGVAVPHRPAPQPPTSKRVEFPASKCTTCGKLEPTSSNKRNIKSPPIPKDISKMLLETKDNLTKVKPTSKTSNNNNEPSDINDNNNAQSYSESSIFSSVDNKFCVYSEVKNHSDKKKPNKGSEGTFLRKKFVKRSLNKVGKLADKLTKRHDSKHKRVDELVATYPPSPNRKIDHSLYRLSSHENSITFDVNSSIVEFKGLNKSKNPLLDDAMEKLSLESVKRIKQKSQSMESILTNEINVPSPQYISSLHEKSNSEQDLNISLMENSSFSLSKSVRVTNFDTDYTPVRPERNKKSQIPVDQEVAAQKPPLPKRPTTLDLPQPSYNPNENTSPGSMNVSLNVNVDLSSAVSPLRRTVLNVNPELGWLPDDLSPRSFTSVNLTLRTPTSEPQPPIDIKSANSGLTYSTSSFDRRNGFQSSVQITVGPSSGTVSAMRLRPRSSYLPETIRPIVSLTPKTGSLPDLSIKEVPLIQRQITRKERLRIELIAERAKLVAMQREVQALETMPDEMTNSMSIADDLRLRNEIHNLRQLCRRLANDVDLYSQSRVPLGETSEEFYQNIYTGQRGLLGRSSIITNPSVTTPSSSTTTSPPMLDSEPPWTCHMCTFSNHPLLDKCEQCEMPRIVLGRNNEHGPILESASPHPVHEDPFKSLSSNTSPSQFNIRPVFHPEHVNCNNSSIK